MKKRIAIILFFFVPIFLLTGTTFKTAASGLPDNLRAEWKTSGSTISTFVPILTWNNPEGGIDTIVIRLRKNNPDMGGCFQDTIIEHWFTTPPSPPPCDIPAKTTSQFSTTPTVYIVPPGKLLNNQKYYWSIWTRVDGKWVSSTGYIEGLGGNKNSDDWFKVSVPDSTRNIRGVNLYTNSQFKHREIDGPDKYQERLNLVNSHLDWARNLLGEGGYVKFFFYGIKNSTQGAEEIWKATVQGAYNRGLIPIVRLQGEWQKDPNIAPWGGYFKAPQTDPNGDYLSAAQAYKRVVASLPQAPNTPLFVELYNEVNYSNENWSNISDKDIVADQYGRFFIRTSQAIDSIGNQQIKLIMGGLGRGEDVFFLRKLLNVPGFKEAATADGFWPVHFYPFPGHSADTAARLQLDLDQIRSNGHLLGYKYQLNELFRKGVNVNNLKVIVTEGGWRIGGQGQTSEEQRINYTRRAFEIWKSDFERIDGVSLFTLDQFADADILDLTDPRFDPNNPNSDAGAFSWVYYDSQSLCGWPTHTHLVYDQLAVETRKICLTLEQGWNQITWPDVLGKKASDIPTECPIAVSKENIWFKPYVKNFGGLNFGFEKDKIYYIKCNQEVIWNL